MLKHKWKGTLGVDAGSIQIMDSAYIKEYGGDVNAKLCHVVDVPVPGEYRIKAKLPDTYEGVVSVDKTITVKGDKIVIGDACYNFDDTWHKVLDASSYFMQDAEQWAVIQTGGDGTFDIVLSVEKA